VVSDCTVVVVLLVSELALSVLLLLLQPLIAQAMPSAMIVAKTVRCFIKSPSSCGSHNGHARVMVPLEPRRWVASRWRRATKRLIWRL
jgi:hypothetical protein